MNELQRLSEIEEIRMRLAQLRRHRVFVYGPAPELDAEEREMVARLRELRAYTKKPVGLGAWRPSSILSTFLK